MNTLGIIIGRLQPPHIGHTLLIDTALKKHDMTLVLLGGNGCTDESNPLTFQQRDILLQKQYCDHTLMIDEVFDMPNDIDWVKSIAKKIHGLGTYDTVTFYGGDLKNDSAMQAIQSFEDELLIDVHYHEIPRSDVTIMYQGSKTPVSATLVRQASKQGNWDQMRSALPKKIAQDIRAYLV